LVLLSLVKVEAYPVWFPVNENLRYVVVALHLLSDKGLKGKVKVDLTFQSEGRKPFKDSFTNDLKGSNDLFLFYEGAIPWDSTTLSGTVKLGKKTYNFSAPIRGYDKLKTSSLVEQGGKSVLRFPTKTFRGSENITMTVPIWDLKEGDYELVVSVISPKLQEEVTFRRPFIVSKYGDNVASFIDYIATEEELREFRKLISLKERINFLRRFWQKRGDEFYKEFRRRVVYADSAFSTPNRLGRYTDMGRIYIKRGKPDEVNYVDFREGGRPYIKWVYYTGGGYTYYFYDPIGTGEYVLVKTDDPEEATFGSRYVAPSLDFDEGGGWEE